MHADEVDTSAELVRTLLSRQLPQWSELPLVRVESYGTDHAIYRLGEELAVRMPRIGWAAGQAEKEATWLPRLRSSLPLAVPVPLALGVPDAGYPFPWAVYEWIPGRPIDLEHDDLVSAAEQLGAFAVALRSCDATGAPARQRGSRGSPLTDLDEPFRRALTELGARTDERRARVLWDESLAAEKWQEPETWLHGDLLPGNLLVEGGRLAAVIDFGGLNVGDPACDLQPAWNVFSGSSRDAFRAAMELDDAAWLRGRGWVLYQTVMALPYYWDTNAGIVKQASRALAEVLREA